MASEDDSVEELIQIIDELIHESVSDSEEETLPLDKPEETRPPSHYIYIPHSTVEFLVTKVILIISSTGLIVLLPLYADSMSIKSDVYSLMLFNNTLSFLLLLVLLAFSKRFCSFYQTMSIMKPPISYKELCFVAFIYTISTFLIMYSIDMKKVLCHLQDPIKSISLVFSLMYYFFFCKKLMGLQRIFATTTIIVGLFITVDYGLCDEFRCRGADRMKKSDDTGFWSWKTHTTWMGLYIFGLALYSAYFMILDRYIVCSNVITPSTDYSTQFLTTVSRLVSFPISVNSMPHTSLMRRRNSKNIQSALHLVVWLHLFFWIFTVLLFWTNLLPSIAKEPYNFNSMLTNLRAGLFCIIPVRDVSTINLKHECGSSAILNWIFLFTYITYSLSSVRFLMLCQSAVHTMAVSSIALPIVGVWWSVFKTSTENVGVIIWNPTISGELICAILGFPIVLIGLVLLSKIHFWESRMARTSTLPNTSIVSNHLA